MNILSNFTRLGLAAVMLTATTVSVDAYSQSDCDFWQNRLQITVVNNSCSIGDSAPVLFSVSCSGTSRCSGVQAAYISEGSQSVFTSLVSGTSTYSDSTESCESARWNTYTVAPQNGNDGTFTLDASIYLLTATCSEDASGTCGCTISPS